LNDNDETQRLQFAKFQPVPEPDGFRFQEPTRLYVEYVGDDFEEIDARTGKVMARGRIERPEKDFGDRREAA
jgi:hypothetical protein